MGARLACIVCALVAASGIAAGAAGAAGVTEVIYKNIPAPQPVAVPSYSFESDGFAQLGGAVEFAGTSRRNASVRAGMSTYACESGVYTGSPECVTAKGGHFEYPITLNVNAVGPQNSVGTLIASVTKTFKIPYRPSQNNTKCTGSKVGAWYSALAKQCYNSKFFRITFPLGKITLPNEVILSVAYNTSDFGSEPQRPKPCNSSSAQCPYDLINVGITDEKNPPATVPTVGTDPLPEDAYQNNHYPEFYCDGGAAGSGIFRLDAGCWTGAQVLFEVKATA